MLLRWTESIAQKVKRKKKVEDNSKKEIWRSVFEPHIPSVPTDETQVSNRIRLTCVLDLEPGLYDQVKTLDHEPPMTQAQFDM